MHGWLQQACRPIVLCPDLISRPTVVRTTPNMLLSRLLWYAPLRTCYCLGYCGTHHSEHVTVSATVVPTTPNMLLSRLLWYAPLRTCYCLGYCGTHHSEHVTVSATVVPTTPNMLLSRLLWYPPLRTCYCLGYCGTHHSEHVTVSATVVRTTPNMLLSRLLWYAPLRTCYCLGYCGTHHSEHVTVSAGLAVVSLHPAVAGWYHHTPHITATRAEGGGGGREGDGVRVRSVMREAIKSVCLLHKLSLHGNHSLDDGAGVRGGAGEEGWAGCRDKLRGASAQNTSFLGRGYLQNLSIKNNINTSIRILSGQTLQDADTTTYIQLRSKRRLTCATLASYAANHPTRFI